MDQIDSPSYDWYHDEGQDLHQHDFLFLARMQMARRMQQWVERFPNRDQVLERLMEEGTFDRRDPDVPDAREELAMAHSSVMVQRLLMRIERIEREVGVARWFLAWSDLSPYVLAGRRQKCL